MLQYDTLKLFQHVCDKPTMYVQDATYSAVSAYIDGYNNALQGGPLKGFREWLAMGGSRVSNLPWFLLLRERHDPSDDLEAPPKSATNYSLLNALKAALDDFAKCLATSGVPRIMADYIRWVESIEAGNAPGFGGEV